MKEGLNSKMDLMIQRLTFSEQVNKIIPYPLSSYTYPRLLPFHFNKERPLIFIFFGNTEYLYQSTYLDYLRKKYPSARIVLYMQDLINRNTKLNFYQIKDKFDLILSYDKGDCEKYGLLYHPTPYSRYPVLNNPTIEPCDVFYCGNAKMRYATILDVFTKCKEMGLKCKFFITACPEEKKIPSEDIVYDHYISYHENLQYVQKAKCILEVMQANADGYTPRLWESIIYDKHLLTDNQSIVTSEFYKKDSMHGIANINNILEWIKEPIKHDNAFKQSLSPIYLLNKVEEYFD